MIQFRSDLAPWPLKRSRSFRHDDPHIHWTPFGAVWVPFVGQGEEFMLAMTYRPHFRRAVDAVSDWAMRRYDQGERYPYDLSAGEWASIQRDVRANG